MPATLSSTSPFAGRRASSGPNLSGIRKWMSSTADGWANCTRSISPMRKNSSSRLGNWGTGKASSGRGGPPSAPQCVVEGVVEGVVEDDEDDEDGAAEGEVEEDIGEDQGDVGEVEGEAGEAE
jgi:hypothetical protein